MESKIARAGQAILKETKGPAPIPRVRRASAPAEVLRAPPPVLWGFDPPVAKPRSSSVVLASESRVAARKVGDALNRLVAQGLPWGFPSYHFLVSGRFGEDRPLSMMECVLDLIELSHPSVPADRRWILLGSLGMSYASAYPSEFPRYGVSDQDVGEQVLSRHRILETLIADVAKYAETYPHEVGPLLDRIDWAIAKSAEMGMERRAREGKASQSP